MSSNALRNRFKAWTEGPEPARNPVMLDVLKIANAQNRTDAWLADNLPLKEQGNVEQIFSSKNTRRKTVLKCASALGVPSEFLLLSRYGNFEEATDAEAHGVHNALGERGWICTLRLWLDSPEWVDGTGRRVEELLYALPSETRGPLLCETALVFYRAKHQVELESEAELISVERDAIRAATSYLVEHAPAEWNLEAARHVDNPHVSEVFERLWVDLVTVLHLNEVAFDEVMEIVRHAQNSGADMGELDAKLEANICYSQWRKAGRSQ